MVEYQKRVVEEGSELLNKIEKLVEFIGSSIFNKMEEEDQLLLVQQSTLMVQYHEVLMKRVHRFRKNGTT
jgi:hypothetical protein